MARVTTAKEARAELEFAYKAAKDFAANKNHATFGDIAPGNFLALRWGMGGDCVLVVKLDWCEPTNYTGLVKELAPKQPKGAGSQ